jgi:16S rRNA (guanine527-N7)-methyltransferase
MVTSRAVASLEVLYRQAIHVLAPGGRMLFMKGTLPESEMNDFAPGRETLHIERLQVPGLDAERHLIWFKKPDDD